MAYDVVVVGGGIGGLTVAALLSARGLSVCLLERQSQVGGCVGRIELDGYDFDPGMGLYLDWGPGEIYDQIFSELPVQRPAAVRLEADYVVRLPDRTDIRLRENNTAFAEEIAAAFPECSKAAIDFYDLVKQTNEQPVRSPSSAFGRALKRFWTRHHTEPDQSTLAFLGHTSTRFQRFIDAQLRAFLHSSIESCAFVTACQALTIPRLPRYAIDKGISFLAERLADGIKQAGGVVRLNSPALRLTFDENGIASGVDLLNGETVGAKRAIISNLTIWDTYGKLVGLNRTPADIKSWLSKIDAKGAYLIYAALEDAAYSRLPSSEFLVAQERSSDENEVSELTISVGKPADDGKRPVTIKTLTPVAPWFSFQTSEEDYEEWDQTALGQVWEKLHEGVPELGAAIEVIESANPRTFYDTTRRKLGMVMGVEPVQIAKPVGSNTIYPNVFLVGDTATSGFGISSVARSALNLANHLTK